MRHAETVTPRASTRIMLPLLAALAVLPLAACDTLNPFDKGEVYKPEVKSDLPAEKLYNDGLAAV